MARVGPGMPPTRLWSASHFIVHGPLQ